MPKSTASDAVSEAQYWEVTEPRLHQAGVTRSTMMGLPCLRLDGQFAASFDRQTGDFLVKLPAARVEQLIAVGEARRFAPAGRRFREWAAVTPERSESWPLLLDEALAFVATLPAKLPRKGPSR